ncbi:hypothetical protein ACWEOZ_23880 [Actinoplanes sp. NPDC004185]
MSAGSGRRTGETTAGVTAFVAVAAALTLGVAAMSSRWAGA